MSYRNTLAGLRLQPLSGLECLPSPRRPRPHLCRNRSKSIRAQLDAFVLAYVEVSDLREQYIAQLQDAQSADEQQRSWKRRTQRSPVRWMTRTGSM